MAIRREKARPLLPSVLLNGFQTPYEMIQGGIFGLGPNSSLNQWSGRFDVSIQPLWQLEASGSATSRGSRQQRGMQSRAIIEFFDAQDMVAADVTRAQARRPVGGGPGRPGRPRPAHRRSSPSTATIEGLRQTTRFGDVLVLVNRPQEAVYALQLLKRGLRRVLHHGRRLQPGAVRAVPRAGLPGPRGRAAPAAGRGPAGGHGAAGLPAPGGQRAAPGDPLSRSAFPDRERRSGFPRSLKRRLRPCRKTDRHKLSRPRAPGRAASAQRECGDGYAGGPADRITTLGITPADTPATIRSVGEPRRQIVLHRADRAGPIMRGKHQAPRPTSGGRSTPTADKPDLDTWSTASRTRTHSTTGSTPPSAMSYVQDPATRCPGQVYNVLYVVVRNGTARTFDASSGLRVRFSRATLPFRFSRGMNSGGRGNGSSSTS